MTFTSSGRSLGFTGNSAAISRGSGPLKLMMCARSLLWKSVGSSGPRCATCRQIMRCRNTRAGDTARSSSSVSCGNSAGRGPLSTRAYESSGFLPSAKSFEHALQMSTSMLPIASTRMQPASSSPCRWYIVVPLDPAAPLALAGGAQIVQCCGRCTAASAVAGS